MKSNFNKKLSINKRTVANLNVRELQAAKGGVETVAPEYSCYETCPDSCAPSRNCQSADTWCTLTCETVCRCWTDYC